MTNKTKAPELKLPEYSEWTCQLFGGGGWNWTPLKGNEPNWFWRWMQYLFFGNKWEKQSSSRDGS